MDVDNAVKGMLDALNGVLYGDDSQIQCLTTRRIEYAGEVGYYMVAVRGVHDYLADVVADDATPALIMWGERVE